MNRTPSTPTTEVRHMPRFVYFIAPSDGPIVSYAIVDAATYKTVDVVIRGSAV